MFLFLLYLLLPSLFFYSFFLFFFSFFFFFFFFFNDTATTEIYTLSLHDALPIYRSRPSTSRPRACRANKSRWRSRDRKSTRLNSSHSQISYAVFCLKKKKKKKKKKKVKKKKK